MHSNKQKNPFKTIKRLRIALRTVEIIFAVILILGLAVLYVPPVKAAVIQGLTRTGIGKQIIQWFGNEAYDKSIFDADFDSKRLQTNDLEYNYSEEYTNFIMFGIDSRTSQFDSSSNSDSNVIVSVHNTTGEVRLVSIYRDTLLRIYNTDGTYNYFKINSAYSLGGAENAINTLNQNLDLQLTDYVTVNFSGVAKIIDTLGGIKVNLTDDEVQQLNYHLKSTISTTGEHAKKISSSGKNIKLNGIQATTYCRIRKATFYDPDTGEAVSNDFGRAARQRSVIMKLVNKAKKASVSELKEMISTVLDTNTEKEKIISTSFSFEKIVDMLPIIFDFSLSGSDGFPSNLTTGTISGASYVIPLGLSANVKALHKYLYDEEDYQPTATVEEIDSYITSYTGYSENSTSGYDTKASAPGEDETTSSDDVDYDYDDKGKSDFY